MWQLHPLLIVHAVTVALAALCTGYAWRRRRTPGAIPLASLMIGVSLWSFTSGLGLLRADLGWQLFWADLTYVGVGLVPASWLLFALQYSDDPAGHDRRVLIALSVVPKLALVLILTNPAHQLFRRAAWLDTSGGFAFLAVERGPLFWAHTLYAYLLLGAGSLMLVRLRRRELYSGQVGVLLFGVSAPWVTNLLFVAGLSPLPHFDLTTVGFLIAGLALIWDLRRFGLLDLRPVARDLLVEQMADSMIVIDADNRVVDMNAAARQSLGLTAAGALGTPIKQLAAPWAHAVEPLLAQPRPVAEELVVPGEPTARVFDLRISPLHDRYGGPPGHLIVWREVTARKEAEEQLRRLHERLYLHVQGTPLGYIECDRELRVKVWNPAAERIFGYSAAEVLGRRARDLIVPEWLWPSLDQLAGELRAGVGGARSTNLNRTRDGREIVCDWHNTVFVGEDGQVSGWASMVQDITDRIATETALAQVNETLQERVDELAALNALTRSIVVEHEPRSIARAVARQLTDLLDVSSTSVLLLDAARENLSFVADYDRAPGTPDLVGTALPLKAVHQQLLGDLPHRSVLLEPSQIVPLLKSFDPNPPEGRFHWALVTPIHISETLHGCIVIASDRAERQCTPDDMRLTETVAGLLSGAIERLRLLELTEEARRGAEAANQAKSHFLAAMSHELRTPLNSMLGYTQLLSRDTKTTAFQHEMLTRVEQSGNHLLLLINDLLDLSKIEAGTLELLEEPIDLPELLGDIAATAQLNAQARGLDFRFNLELDRLDRPLPTAVAVDFRRLRQVLLNLLGNAVKFTDAGLVSLSVGYRPADDEGTRWRVRFRVDDTGTGIAAPDLAQIFRPFQQAGAPARRVDGVGLGLAICDELLRLMGAELRVTSTPGAGSSFWFELDLRTVADEQGHEPAGGARRPALDASGLTALIADEDQHRSRLRDLLVPLGFGVIVAGDRHEAIALARQRRPALVFVCVPTPPDEGTALIAELRAMPAARGATIIACTAAQSATTRQAALEAGANVCLTKPFAGQLLGDVLRHLLAVPPRGAGPDERSDERPAAAPETLVRPPAEELATLLDLIVVGNLRAIQRHVRQLAQGQSEYGPFAQEVYRLTDSFQIDGLRELLAGDQPGATEKEHGING